MKLQSRLRFTNTQAILIGIFLLALLLRLFTLDLRGLWRDEVLTLQVTQRGIEGIFSYRFGWPANQTPLYYLTVWLTSLPVDPAATTMLVRLPSALAGALTPLVVFALGREFFGKWQGLLAALLTALSTAHLSYSQDLRPYAMVVFLTVTTVYCLVKAERTRSGRWWLAFTVSMIANLLNAYITLTLVLPALTPYLIWVLWKAWLDRTQHPKHFRHTVLSLSAIALIAIYTLLQIAQVPKTGVISDQFSIKNSVITVIGLVPWLLQWFTKFGISADLGHGVQWFLAVLGCLGLYRAFRSGGTRGAILCLLFIMIGPLVFAAALASERYAVFQRYAIFAMPFYFLLVSNGILFKIPARTEGNTPSWTANALKGVTLTLTSFIIVFFALGTYNYISADNHHELTYRPDFRGVSQYLAQHAKPEDTLVFVGWDAAVTNFYWGGKPPASAYSALDPRLFSHKAEGDIYWIVSYDGMSTPKGIQQWKEIEYFDQIAVVREEHEDGGISLSMERLASHLTGTLDMGVERTLKLLTGCIAEARGDAVGAATIYKENGAYNPIGAESLTTANGFVMHSDGYEAWQNAVRAKFDQPGNVELHEWMAKRLLEDGYSIEGQTEKQIAGLLQNMR